MLIHLGFDWVGHREQNTGNPGVYHWYLGLLWFTAAPSSPFIQRMLQARPSALASSSRDLCDFAMDTITQVEDVEVIVGVWQATISQGEPTSKCISLHIWEQNAINMLWPVTHNIKEMSVMLSPVSYSISFIMKIDRLPSEAIALPTKCLAPPVLAALSSKDSELLAEAMIFSWEVVGDLPIFPHGIIYIYTHHYIWYKL